MLKLKQDII